MKPDKEQRYIADHSGPLLVLHDTLQILTRQLKKFQDTQPVGLNGRALGGNGSVYAKPQDGSKMAAC